MEVKDEAVTNTEGAVEEKEVVLEEEVAVDETPPAPEAPQQTQEQKDVLDEAHKALCAWKEVFDKELPIAKDVYYYAEELYVEDKDFWDHGKHKVNRGEWTTNQFDDELQKLKKKQEPVWDRLMKQVSVIEAKLETPIEVVKASDEAVKASIGPLPIKKMIGGKGPTEQEARVRHEYHWKLQQEFKDAKAQYNEICGYPEGLLEQVKLFRLNVVREDINVTEYVHSDSKFKIPKLTKNLPLMGKS
jgi:hypothetical protein